MSTLGKDGGEPQKLILPYLMFFLKCLVTILAWILSMVFLTFFREEKACGITDATQTPQN